MIGITMIATNSTILITTAIIETGTSGTLGKTSLLNAIPKTIT